jgi:hypothetical protein
MTGVGSQHSTFNAQRLSTRLLDLPTEVILQILRDLSNTDLLSLATLSRRLHYTTLPLYFQRHGVRDLRGSLTIYFPEDLASAHSYLPGLRMALFLDSVREIEFVFRGAPHTFRDMKEAASLLLKLTHVDRVKLNLQCLTMTQAGRIDIPHTPDGQDNMAILCSSMSSLFDAIYAKSCVSFRACYGHLQNKMYPHRTFDLVRELKKARLIKIIASLMRKTNFGRKEPNWRVPGFAGPPLASLRAFHLESRLFLWSPLLAWALMTFERSSPTLVELSFHLYIQTKDWTHFLPHIFLPSLSKLAIASYDLEFSDLIKFLRRHPRITSLCLCNGRLNIDSKNRTPILTDLFSALTHLCAPSDYILHLLQNTEQFLNLVNVHIWPFYGTVFPHLRLVKQNEALELVAKLHPAGKKIHLTIHLFPKRASYGSIPMLVLPESGVEETLWNVRSLRLRVAFRLPIDHDPAPVARWLALYPALREVEFVQELFPLAFDETSKRAFAKPILEACPRMKYVTIGEDRRSAESWGMSASQNGGAAQHQPVVF